MGKIAFTSALLVFTGWVNLSCSENALTAFQKEDDASLYAEALSLVNSGSYSEAITKFEGLSAGYLKIPEVAFHYSAAYAGRGGYDLLTILTDIDSMGATNILLYALQTYNGATAATADDLITARDLIVSLLGTAGHRNDDENFYGIVVSFYTIAQILSFYADNDDDDASNWTAAKDACSSANLPDTQARALATSLATMIQSANNLTTIPNGLDLTDIETACASLPANYNFCEIENPDNLTTDMVEGVRTIIQEGDDFGIGPCTSVGDTVTTCLCP